MKKQITRLLIVLLAVIAAISILLQAKYLRDIHKMRNEQFMTLVRSALTEVAKALEREEMRRYIITDSKPDDGVAEVVTKTDKVVPPDASQVLQPQPQQKIDTIVSNPIIKASATCPPWAQESAYKDISVNPLIAPIQSEVWTAYLYQRDLLDAMIVTELLKAYPTERSPVVETRFLNRSIQEQLTRIGINEPFGIRLYDRFGNLVYEKDLPQKTDVKEDNSIKQPLFSQQKTASGNTAYMQVVFYKHNRYMNSTQYAWPSFVTTSLIFLICVFAMIMFYRQQQFIQGHKNFANNMTHELKTPVSSIKLAWEMLNDPTIENSEVTRKKLLKVIENETNRLTLLVEKVLQFSLVDQGKIKFYPVELDANEILLEVSSIYEFKVEETGGELILNLEAENTWISFDRMHLQNIFFNLLDNALKYRKKDTPLMLELNSYNQNGNLVVIVKDNGIGIAKEARKHIFDQFYRVNTGELHNVKGFGLGLAYVSRILKVMKGKVRVESKLGEGTRMIVEIPNILPENNIMH